MLLTFNYRIKTTKGSKRELDRQAQAVNTIWNFCGETHESARKHNKLLPFDFTLINLTSGTSRELGLHSDTIQAICKEFVARRNQIKRRPRWRGNRSLGWIPFQSARAIRLKNDFVTLLGRKYRLWLSRPSKLEKQVEDVKMRARCLILGHDLKLPTTQKLEEADGYQICKGLHVWSRLATSHRSGWKSLLPE